MAGIIFFTVAIFLFHYAFPFFSACVFPSILSRYPRQNGKAAFPTIRITIPQAEAAGKRHKTASAKSPWASPARENLLKVYYTTYCRFLQENFQAFPVLVCMFDKDVSA